MHYRFLSEFLLGVCLVSLWRPLADDKDQPEYQNKANKNNEEVYRGIRSYFTAVGGDPFVELDISEIPH